MFCRRIYSYIRSIWYRNACSMEERRLCVVPATVRPRVGATQPRSISFLRPGRQQERQRSSCGAASRLEYRGNPARVALQTRSFQVARSSRSLRLQINVTLSDQSLHNLTCFTHTIVVHCWRYRAQQYQKPKCIANMITFTSVLHQKRI